MRKSFFYFIVVFPIFTILFVSLTILYLEDQKYNQISKYFNEFIMEDFINDNKKGIKSRVEFINDIIKFESNQVENILKEDLKAGLNIAYQITDQIYKNNKGKLTKTQIRKRVIDTLSQLKYNNVKGRYYITDYTTNIMLWHYLDVYRGKNVSNSIDKKGVNRLGVLKQSIKDQQFGIVKFYLNKTVEDKTEYPRLSGVFHYKPLDILVGTGEYLDEVEEKLKKQVMQRVILLNKDQKTQNIKVIKFNQKDESFECILKTEPCNYLVNITGYKDNLVDIVMDVNTEYKGFIKFKSNDSDGVIRYIYYLYHKDWNWVIQSDFYEDDMMYSLSSIQSLLKENEDEIFSNNLLIIATFIIIAIIGSFIILNIVKNLILNYARQIKDKSDELETIFATTKDGIAILDKDANFLFCNDAYFKMTGFTKEELLSKNCITMSSQGDKEKSTAVMKEVFEKKHIENFEKEYIINDNKKVSVSISLSLMPDNKRVLISARDITELKKKERSIKEYLNIIDKNILTSTTDNTGIILHASEAFAKISGYKKDELIGQNHNIIRHPDMPSKIYDELWETISKNEVWSGELKNKKKNGGYYWVDVTISPIFDENNKKTGYTALRHDITDKKIIEEISITDGLTGIFNRRYFDEQLPNIINVAKRHDELLSFIIMDIDFFKQYNDTYGHQMGDEVLKKVSAVLKDSLQRADDACFRIGGEEFCIIFNVETKEKAFEFATKIKDNVEALKIEHKNSKVSEFVTVSIGLVCKKATTIKSKDEIYKDADKLLYDAKESGRNKVCI